MKIKCNKVRLQYDENRNTELVISTKENIQAEVEQLKAIILQGKELQVEVKQFRQKRSLDSNSYLWLLLNEMASILHTTKDELYIEILSRYGVFTHLVVKENIVARVKAEWKLVKELGKVNINGKEGIQLQVYFGSSGYDTKEMSTLLEGVVSECKEMGINTITPAEIQRMKSQWGVKQ